MERKTDVDAKKLSDITEDSELKPWPQYQSASQTRLMTSSPRNKFRSLPRRTTEKQTFRLDDLIEITNDHDNVRRRQPKQEIQDQMRSGTLRRGSSLAGGLGRLVRSSTELFLGLDRDNESDDDDDDDDDDDGGGGGRKISSSEADEDSNGDEASEKEDDDANDANGVGHEDAESADPSMNVTSNRSSTRSRFARARSSMSSVPFGARGRLLHPRPPKGRPRRSELLNRRNQSRTTPEKVANTAVHGSEAIATTTTSLSQPHPGGELDWVGMEESEIDRVSEESSARVQRESWPMDHVNTHVPHRRRIPAKLRRNASIGWGTHCDSGGGIETDTKPTMKRSISAASAPPDHARYGVRRETPPGIPIPTDAEVQQQQRVSPVEQSEGAPANSNEYTGKHYTNTRTKAILIEKKSKNVKKKKKKKGKRTVAHEQQTMTRRGSTDSSDHHNHHHHHDVLKPLNMGSSLMKGARPDPARKLSTLSSSSRHNNNQHGKRLTKPMNNALKLQRKSRRDGNERNVVRSTVESEPIRQLLVGGTLAPDWLSAPDYSDANTSTNALKKQFQDMRETAVNASTTVVLPEPSSDHVQQPKLKCLRRESIDLDWSQPDAIGNDCISSKDESLDDLLYSLQINSMTPQTQKLRDIGMLSFQEESSGKESAAKDEVSTVSLGSFGGELSENHSDKSLRWNSPRMVVRYANMLNARTSIRDSISISRSNIYFVEHRRLDTLIFRMSPDEVKHIESFCRKGRLSNESVSAFRRSSVISMESITRRTSLPPAPDTAKDVFAKRESLAIEMLQLESIDDGSVRFFTDDNDHLQCTKVSQTSQAMESSPSHFPEIQELDAVPFIAISVQAQQQSSSPFVDDANEHLSETKILDDDVSSSQDSNYDELPEKSDSVAPSDYSVDSHAALHIHDDLRSSTNTMNAVKEAVIRDLFASCPVHPWLSIDGAHIFNHLLSPQHHQSLVQPAKRFSEAVELRQRSKRLPMPPETVQLQSKHKNRWMKYLNVHVRQQELSDDANMKLVRDPEMSSQSIVLGFKASRAVVASLHNGSLTHIASSDVHQAD